MKKRLIGLGVLVVLIAVGVFFFLGNLNDIVRAAVEQVGSDMTQTNVSLREVDIELTSGKGALRGFSVTNPKGFSDDDAFKFDEVAVTLDILTVRSDPVVIKEIVIQGPSIVYEGDKKAPNIIIENLYLRHSTVAVIAPLLNEKLSVPLPTIHLTDIGKEGKGATPDEIADQVMSAVLKGAQDAVANAKIDINKLTGAAMEQVEK